MRKILLFSFTAITAIAANAQNCTDLFISEYVEGTNNNKAIELYNPTAFPIVLDGVYSMGRDRDGAGAPMVMDITGTIAPFDVRVFAIDKRDPNGTGNEVAIDAGLEAVADTFLNPVYVQSNSPMYFNGNDAFVLVKNGTTILDIIGRIGENPGTAWSVPGDPNTRWWTANHTLIRKPTIQHGVFTNPDVFDPSLEWDSVAVNTFDSLGMHHCTCGVVSVQERINHQFSIFPNPISQGQFAIRSSHDLNSYSILSMDGKLIERKLFMQGLRMTNVTLPKADPGLYFIVIEFSDGTRTSQKLISR